MQGAGFLTDLRRLLADEGLTLAILVTVAAATVLAFGFGATSDIVASMPILGVVTPPAAARSRTGKTS
jgi:hypothetical protein